MSTPLTFAQAQKLKPGTLLRVLDGRSMPHTPSGSTIKFKGARTDGHQEVFVEGYSGSWFPDRFEVLKEPQRRDARGRFAAPVTKATVKRDTPSALRPGSLYAVKRKRGYTTARLRRFAHDDFLVFSQHKGRPFIVRRKQVALANKEEVNQYLQTNN